MKEKTIILFNHKGGVSKTLTTFNLAWMLTLKGKKVLVVDCDPQCNMSALFLGIENNSRVFSSFLSELFIAALF